MVVVVVAAEMVVVVVVAAGVVVVVVAAVAAGVAAAGVAQAPYRVLRVRRVRPVLSSRRLGRYLCRARLGAVARASCRGIRPLHPCERLRRPPLMVMEVEVEVGVGVVLLLCRRPLLLPHGRLSWLSTQIQRGVQWPR